MPVTISSDQTTVEVTSRNDTVIIQSSAPDVLEIESVLFDGTPYTGAYEITPSQQTQVLNTRQKSMSSNIVVNPIPSNYGLITWDGSVITVS